MFRERHRLGPGETHQAAPRPSWCICSTRRAASGSESAALTTTRQLEQQATQARSRQANRERTNMTDSHFDRRSLLKGGAADAGRGGDDAADQLLGFAKAWAQTAPWKPESRRQDQSAALEALRGGRGRRVHEDRRRLPEGHRRQGQRLQRILRRHPAQGVGRRQHRAGPGHGVGPAFAAAPVPRQVHRVDRRRRLSRQEVRRLGQSAEAYGKVGGKWIGIPVAINGGADQLPHRRVREGRLQGIPEGHRGLPRAVQGA